MKIDILVNDGSPLGVTMRTVYGQDGQIGVGGAELALLTNCETWARMGHEVVLYNNPRELSASPFEQRNLGSFDPRAARDVLVVFRSPNVRALDARGYKIWWSCDQYTTGNFREFAPNVQKIVTISPFHAKHFEREYNIRKTVTIDLPVRVGDYALEIEKVPGRCIWTSVPDRGLQVMYAAWPLIRRDFPGASLLITSDYRLWGVGEPRNEQWRARFLSYQGQGVIFKGALPRAQLVQEQLRAQVLAYSCIYDELFCIAVAEAQVAGAYPVTSTYGSLETTNMGHQIPGNPAMPEWVSQFASAVCSYLGNPELTAHQAEVQKKALERFSPEVIGDEWQKLFDEA